MAQLTLHHLPVEARRRRRYRIASRTYFGYAIGFFEGLLAIALALLAVRPETPQDLVLPVFAGAAYGLSCALASAQFLRSLATRHPRLSRSLLIWLLGIVTFVAVLLLSESHAQAGGWLVPLAVSLGLVAVRVAFLVVSTKLMRTGRLQIERVALIGKAADLAEFRRNVQVWRQGAQVVRSLALDETTAPGLSEADTAAFALSCVEDRCDTVLLVGPFDVAASEALVAPFRHYALNVMLSPTNGDPSELLVDVLPVGPMQPGRVLAKPIDDTGRMLKRAFDIAGAGFGLLLLAPLFLIVAILIKLDSRGPVFFLQERRGFNGRTFRIIKFRSMTVMEDGHAVRQAVLGDIRITRIGSFLRRSSVDELPQLLNVLRGDMSLVGPRPHAISHDAELARRFERYAQRQRIAPGITGWAQVNGFRGDTSTLEKIEGRTLHDLYYVEHWSLWFDIRILVLTFLSRKVRDNAH